MLGQVVVPRDAIVGVDLNVAAAASLDLLPKQVEREVGMDGTIGTGVVEVAVHVLGEDDDRVDVRLHEAITELVGVEGGADVRHVLAIVEVEMDLAPRAHRERAQARIAPEWPRYGGLSHGSLLRIAVNTGITQ